MTNYQLAAAELALAHQRAERGAVAPVQFEERRRALAGVMASAHEELRRYYPGEISVR